MAEPFALLRDLNRLSVDDLRQGLKDECRYSATLLTQIDALLAERDALREAVAAYLAALDTEGIADDGVLRAALVAVPDTEKGSNE